MRLTVIQLFSIYSIHVLCMPFGYVNTPINAFGLLYVCQHSLQMRIISLRVLRKPLGKNIIITDHTTR
jgi:hypothetical protein